MAGKNSKTNRPVLRFLLFEGLALAGFIHFHYHPIADALWEKNFYYGDLFWLAGYPLLYIYRWIVGGGCLGTILLPLGFVLNWGLGVSAYLWAAYGLLIAGSPYYYALIHHEIILGVLFAFLYFPVLQPILGVSRRVHTLGELFWILFYSGLGGFLCFLLGRFVNEKFGTSIGSNNTRFLIWLGLILLGGAIGAMVAQRRDKGD